jgi:pyruvate ferredoxin oxidoreductase beta subunit
MNEEQRVKFYQTGTFTVGNRLLDPSKRTVQASLDRSNALTSGHRACQGCGEALGARYVLDAAMRATNGRLVAVNATGCLEVFSTPYPESAWQVAWLHSLFGNAAAVASGVAAALRVKGSDVRVLAQGGDGGTMDIGFGCLSGMFERNDDVLYVCYDNEAYMNTGVQRSSATPAAARTSTTPAVGEEPGNAFGTGKNLPILAMAHGIPYVATASVADLHDLEAKVARAMVLHGARYLHVHVPAPSAGGAIPPRRFRSRAWPSSRVSSRSSKRRTARSCARLRSGVAPRSRTTCGCKHASRTCSTGPPEARRPSHTSRPSRIAMWRGSV